MSNLPLQPTLRPRPPWQRFAATLIVAAVAVVALAAWNPNQANPPRYLISTGPDWPDEHPEPASYHRTVSRLIDEAQHQVVVAVYVCYPERDRSGPVSDLGRRLAAAIERGVAVEVILDLGTEWGSDEISDKHATAVAWLTELGVPVRLDDLATTSHQKLVIVDQRWVVSGSHNWTYSAMRRNREVSILIDDPTWAETLLTWLTPPEPQAP